MEKGPCFILEDFDILYGVMKHFDSIDVKTRDTAWKTVYKGVDQLLRELQDELNETISDDMMSDKRKRCCILKMLMYVFCSLITLNEESEERAAKKAENQAVGKGQRKKQATCSPDWDRQRDRAIDLLMKICIMSLYRLFTPPVVEDEFVDMTTRVCYKICGSQAAMRKDQLKNNLFHILSHAVSKHKHGLNFCVKVVQLVQQKEFLVKDMAALIEVMVKTHGQKQIVSEILQEIDRIDMSKDNSGTKNVSEFVREVAERVPKAMISNMSTLMDFLDQDAYMIRSATLSALGSIVSIELSDPDSPSRIKRLRDELLDRLEDHILDVATYTRGRAISVWTRLCQEGKIPLSRLETLIEAVVNRLRDKAVYVRKQTIIFLTEFLKQNPFAAKLPLEKLKQAYAKEKAKLDRTGDGPVADAGDMPAASNIEEEDLIESWQSIEEDFIKYWDDISSQSGVDSSDEVGDSGEDAPVDVASIARIEQVAHKFRSLVQGKKFRSALELVKQLKSKFPKSSIFSSACDADEDESDGGSSSDADLEDPISSRKRSLPASIKSAKRIFLLQEEKNTVSMDEVRTIEGVARGLVQSQRGDGDDHMEEEEDVVADVQKQQVLVKYLKDCVNFAEQIKTAIPLVCSMLYSASVSDCQEAIDFFVTAHEFEVQGSLIGIRKMIVLIFGDKTVREAVIDAYKRVYLNSPSLSHLSARQKSLSVVKSLMELVEGANVGERLSLQELLRHLMVTTDITSDHTQILFEKFAMKLPGTTEHESRIAVHLIGMLASADRSLVQSNMETLITVGLGSRAASDSRLVEQTCIALQKVAIENPTVEDEAIHSYRMDRNHKLFIELNRLLTDGLGNMDDPHYIPMSEEAIRTIYKLSENPDAVCGDMLRDMLRYILTCDANNSDSSKENEEVNTQSSTGTFATTRAASTQPTTIQETLTDTRVPSDVLSRFLSCAGSVALNQLIHMESSVLTEMKIRKQLKDAADAKKKKSRVTQASARKTGNRHSSAGTPSGMEEEIGLAGASAVDDEIEQFRINRIVDDPRNLLNRLAPVVVHIVTHHDKYPDPKLKTTASLTLSKFMCCSHRFCAENLRLLFTILQKSEEPVIRQNAIISLGDLCVRFPNLLDSWTHYLYAPLNDPDVEVRRNALKVLSRLILSDMVKVKGQVSELAKIVVDDDDSLAALARLFFTELRKKENEIYNILPDIISNLSGGDVEIEEHKFQTVMKFLFSLIEKDRQTQCLVEKLCQRFRATLIERQWRDLTFCLTIMSFSEKSVTKLYEHLGAFADKLTCEAVYEGIKSILAAANKITPLRPEFKQLLEEFEGKVEECRNKGISKEDESEIARVVGTPSSASKQHHPSSRTIHTPGTSRATADRATGRKNRTTKKSVARKKVTTAKKTARRKKQDSDEEDESDEEVRTVRKQQQPAAATRQSSRVTRAKQQVKKLFEESEDDSD